MYITSTGGVGIGTDTPGAYKLNVQGDIYTSGNGYKPAAGGWLSSSDARLKKNILPLGEALKKMLSLKGVTYQWQEPEKHGNMDGTYMGMTAQDIEKVFPEWVTTKDGVKYVGYIGFEALTVEAVRELKEENDALKKRLEVLESKIENKK